MAGRGCGGAGWRVGCHRWRVRVVRAGRRNRCGAVLWLRWRRVSHCVVSYQRNASTLHARCAAAIRSCAHGGQYIGEIVRLHWRANLVKVRRWRVPKHRHVVKHPPVWWCARPQVFHEQYYHGRLSYWLNQVDAQIDNADQRITEDIDQFTMFAGQLLFSKFRVPASIFFVMGQTVFSIAFVASKVSALSVLAAIGYFLVAVLITTCLLIPVARATFRANQAEGNFRYLHARIREFSESITFINGQANELKKAGDVFSVCVELAVLGLTAYVSAWAPSADTTCSRARSFVASFS